MESNYKTKKAIKIFIICMCVILALCGAGFFVFGVLLKDDTVITYSFSGYVFADGEALEGAKVSCGVKNTETDENGYYSFDGLYEVASVSVSKNNYLFDNKLVFVDKNAENVNFDGYEIFDMYGTVKNGEEPVAFADIEVSSKAGKYATKSNNFGEFYLPKLAGSVTLNAVHENMNLFSQSFDKTKTDLVVTGTTSVVGKIIADSDDDYDFELTLNNEKIDLSADLSFSISGVEPNSVLKLTSEKYHIDNSSFVVSVQDSTFEFNAQKYYSVVGKVQSGVVPLQNAKVLIGKTAVYSNAQGEYEICGLYGNCNATASLRGFSFETLQVGLNCQTANFVGTFSATGTIITDDGKYDSIEIVSGNNKVSSGLNGEFVLNGIELNDVIRVETDCYFVVENNVTVGNTNSISFELKKLYDLQINVCYGKEKLDGVKAIVGNKSYVSNDGVISVGGLYGTNEITLELDGYEFDEKLVASYLRCSFSVEPYKYFDVCGQVKSGDIIIAGAKISYLGGETFADENGNFEIDNLYLAGTLSVSASDYNTQTVDYSIENKILLVNLSYNILGVITSGNKSVADVKVTLNDVEVETSNASGEFNFLSVYGTSNLKFEKKYYTFESVQVQKTQAVQVDGTYYITGRAFDKTGSIEGLQITLLKNADQTEQNVLTNENGTYTFSGLSGEYILYYDINFSTNLYMANYSISEGGIYNFVDSGYKIKGRVMSGGNAVAGVKVTAGELSTTTNEDGYYKFDLLSKETTLLLEKDGYVFENNNLVVDQTFDKREDVNFECSYGITGKIVSGTSNVAGVAIRVGEQECVSNTDGEFNFSGLKGTNNIILALENYYFVGADIISDTGNYNFVAMFDLNVTIKTSDVLVDGVNILANGTNYVAENGQATIKNLQLGDTISFEKTGYNFENVKLDEYMETLQVQTSFCVLGTVDVAGKSLAGVLVVCGSLTTLTNENGEFEFDNLVGENTISLSKENYSFDEILVLGYENIEAHAKFGVFGKVTLNGNGLADVKVVAGKKVAYTNENGEYSFDGLNSKLTLVLEKTGYEFQGEFGVDGPSEKNFVSTYKIAGFVKSGGIIIENASVKLSNGDSTTTDENGYFEICGLDGTITLQVEASGYDDAGYDPISSYANDVLINLTYSVSISLSTGLSGVEVCVNGETKSFSTSLISLSNLFGEQIITIQKEGYEFSPSKFAVTKQSAISITVKKEFAISGTVTTTSGIPAFGVKITAGGVEAVTDKNGNYTLSHLTETVQVKLLLEVLDTSYKGEDFKYSMNIDQVSTDTTKNITVDEQKYIYFLFKNGYQLLTDAKTYQIFADGTVGVKAAGGIVNATQYVSMIFKKDSQNHKIIQNLNWYNGTMAGVDPRVVQLTYVDLTSKTVKYQFVRGEKVSKDTAEFTTTWEANDVDYGTVLENTGTNPEGFFPYVINQSTISSIENISFDGNDITFTLKLDKSNSEMYYYYTKQMAVMCDSQQFQAFDHIYLTYTVSNTGYIKTMVVDEVYTVKSSGFTATVTDNFNYTFLTSSANEIISDIKIDTVENIKKSLEQETPVSASANSLYVDLYYDERRYLV